MSTANSIPVILIAPSTESKGAEFADLSVSLSNRYSDAIIAAGGLPQILAATTDRRIVAESVRRCDGVLLTGGDDINPKLYFPNLPENLAKTVEQTDEPRDAWEQQLVREIFDQRKAVLGICRGHQMLNVALGGTLWVDIPSQVPNALNHNQMARKTEPVHDVSVATNSMLSEMTGMTTLGVNSTHHQAIATLATPLLAVAQSSDGIIEATELKDASQLPFLLTVQFHPERMLDHTALFLKLFSSFVRASTRRDVKHL